MFSHGEIRARRIRGRDKLLRSGGFPRWTMSHSLPQFQRAEKMWPSRNREGFVCTALLNSAVPCLPQIAVWAALLTNIASYRQRLFPLPGGGGNRRQLIPGSVFFASVR